MKPNHELIQKIVADCLFKKEEILNDQPPPNAVKVEGITCTMFFHPERLKAHKEELKEILSEFPDSYMKHLGGGYTFQAFCYTKDNDLWTGLHSTMETLLCLGIGNNLIEYCLPRELWVALHKEMQYLSIDLNA